ncbi:MAG: hypothetical protein HKO66_09670 [Saprospiraceae bacterium]|nr:hypothetical protein [Bacteroidia bacterium]NNE14490.1 hypothetical protein [Saprospiraceae bacterium]NNL92487.1 hypothetical protein [Saprospiraceae bacterium]
MKHLGLILSLSLCICLTSCETDTGSCLQSDWIGVYNLDTSTEQCSGTNTSLNEQIVFTAGSNSNTVLFDGLEITLDGCALDLGLIGTATLEGSVLSLNGLGCSGTYNKQ